jgi:hypothetical protein
MIRRGALIAIAVALLAVVLSACAVYKPESFSASQPGGIGSVRLHLALCTARLGEEPEFVAACKPSGEENEAQQILAFAVPKGSTVPQSFSAAPTSTGPTLAFSRNQEVSERTAELKPDEEGKPAWPPAGDEVVGYLSNTFITHEGDNLEWSLNADFGLPAGADGGSFNTAYATGLVTGFRYVEEPSLPASRPIDCHENHLPEYDYGECFITEELAIGVSDLKLAPEQAAAAPVFVGGQVKVPFKLDFASTTGTVAPNFTLGGTTTVPKGSASPTEPTFTPTPVDPTSHRSSALKTLAVKVPARAKPGTYQATLTAATSSGGGASGTATIVVSKPKIKLGKLSLNKAKGTATLAVTVPSAGTLTLSGKGLAKVKGKAKGTKPKVLRLTVRASGKGKSKLRETGALKAKAKVSFKPTSGAAVSKSRSLKLKLNG